MTDILGAQVKNALQPLPAHGATVGDVMTKEVEVINVDDSLVYATERMKAKRIRHLPVLDDEGDLVGVLSDRDICAAFGDPVRALQAKPDEPGAASIRVEEAMSRPVMTTTPDRLCSQVARDFVAISASAFPVIDETGTLVGMLSYIDVLRGLAQTREPS
jgi:acetoin utilization protein AcuB